MSSKINFDVKRYFVETLSRTLHSISQNARENPGMYYNKTYVNNKKYILVLILTTRLRTHLFKVGL